MTQTMTAPAKLSRTERALLEGIHSEMTAYGLIGAIVTGTEDLRTARRLERKGMLVQDIDCPQMWVLTAGGLAQFPTPADRILDAIRAVTTYYCADWASLSAVRDESALPRKVFDATMLELAYAGRVVLAPEDNQKTLTRAEEHNALYIGGEHKHLAQIA